MPKDTRIWVSEVSLEELERKYPNLFKQNSQFLDKINAS